MYRAWLSGIFVVYALLFGVSSFAEQSSSGKAAEGPPQLVDAPGKDVVARLCSDCHDAETRVMKLKRSDEGWVEVLTEMQSLGVTAKPEEVDVMLTYLTTNYGCEKKQKSGPCEAAAVPAVSHD